MPRGFYFTEERKSHNKIRCEICSDLKLLMAYFEPKIATHLYT